MSSSSRRRAPARPGTNATLGKFASGYTGLTLTNTTVQYPKGVLYKNGDRCAKGTPDAGKVGEVRARWWVLSTQPPKNGQPQVEGGINTVHPGDLRFVNRQIITAFFGPDNATIPKPPASTVNCGLVQTLAGNGPVATTTTAPATATTVPATVPATTPTTSPPSGTSTTTSKPASSSTSTTAKPSTTSTTK